jgi:hypothetical protein
MFTRRQALLGDVAAGTLTATLPNLASAAPVPARATSWIQSSAQSAWRGAA